MPNDYGKHHNYMKLVKDDAIVRKKNLEASIREVFSDFIEVREVEVVVFSEIDALELANAIFARPLILKPLLACCNIAGRAIERDLNIKNLNTYDPHLTEDHAKVIAGYIKPFLPAYIEINALSSIDRIFFIDKEIRKLKGRWEKLILKALTKYGSIPFKKRKFAHEGEEFEIDAAAPLSGDIQMGIDVKRIEARRDIHKRCDEIVNKASKLKSVFPKSKFGAVIFYPFIEEQVNIQNRLHSPNIDCVVFASESRESVNNAIRLLLSSLQEK
ncbi:MAG TPA: hypothetical protein VM123_17270 [archaeon]|nr:hypothetical protein [archaeon]